LEVKEVSQKALTISPVALLSIMNISGYEAPFLSNATKAFVEALVPY